MEPRFLSIEEVLEIHEKQIRLYGGVAGVADNGLLESAVAQPQMTFSGQFLHPDLPSMAAAYLFHLVMNHPFVDGNKRTGAEAALVFLHLNGKWLNATPEEYAEFVLEVAASQRRVEAVSAFFDQRVVALP